MALFPSQQSSPERLPTNSSWVKEVSYSGGVLTVITKDGHAYRYAVPYDVWMRLQAAPSKGRFINQEIKGRYPQL